MSGPDLLPQDERAPDDAKAPEKRAKRAPAPAPEDKREKRERLEQVQKQLDKGSVKKAIQELEKHIEAHPDDVEGRLRLAQLFVQQGKEAEAYEWLVAAASGFAQRGFLDKAIALLHRAWDLDESKPEPMLIAAEYQVKRGHAGDARKALIKARGRYRRKRDHDKAMLVAQKRALLVPDAAAWLDVARLLVDEGKTKQAMLILDEQTARAEKKERRRFLRARLWLNPTPRSFWRWLRG